MTLAGRACAWRLTGRILAGLMPENGEVLGLLALSWRARPARSRRSWP